MTNGGNMGINNPTPSSTFDLVGTIQLDLPGAETDGYVLTTDASGVSTWEAPPIGPTGPTGPQGAKGDKGDKGDTGK